MSAIFGATIRHFEVKRGDLRESRLVESAKPAGDALQAGQVLLRIEHFALTANNITYATFGDVMQYWNFFPAQSGWGRVPVWGFAVVEASYHEQVLVGERVYGYFPMSSHLLVQADRISPAGFIDASAHRQPMAAIYNQYTRCASDPGYDAAHEAEQMLLRPLFMTSFLIDDFLADNQFFGARRVVLSSASSKTAYGCAFMLAKRVAAASGSAFGSTANNATDSAPLELDTVVGLTSRQNSPFVHRLGFYGQINTYDQISSLPKVPTVYVDMAGSRELREAIHQQLGDSLQYSCAVGGTHWEDVSGANATPLPGPKPVLFFAPAQVKKRLAEWGCAQFAARTAQAWAEFMSRVNRPGEVLLTVTRQLGDSAMQQRYVEVLEGKTAADQGIVLGFGMAE